MAQRRDFVILNEKYCFCPRDNHPLLGRICSDANQPNRNYFPLDPSPYHSKDAPPFCFDASDPEMIVNSAESSTARISLDKIFKILRKKQKDRTSNWRAEKVRIFTLPQEDEVLSNMINDNPLLTKTNKWLADKDSLYMITGYMTMINAHFSNDESWTMSTELKASLTKAIEAAMQAAGGAPLRLPELVAALKSSLKLSSSWKATYTEETVVAVKYRQIVKKWRLKSWLLEENIQLRNAHIQGANMFGPGTVGEQYHRHLN